MNLKHLYNHLRGKTKAKNPAKITLRNIYAVLQAFFRKKRRQMGGFDIPSYMYEQIIWRRIQVIILSEECWTSGHCTECGCEITGKTMEDRACDGGCYPVMMSKDVWDKYKKDNLIKIFE